MCRAKAARAGALAEAGRMRLFEMVGHGHLVRHVRMRGTMRV